jgi:hypothetical protein
MAVGIPMVARLALVQANTSVPNWLPIAVFMAAVVGVPIGIYLFYRGFSVLARKRLIQNIPHSTIRSAPIGQVEISGKAAGPYTILSPLSQTDCYYYRAEAHVLGERGDHPSSPQRVTESLSVPFFLKDETGSIMVDARGADAELPCTFDEIVGTDSGECLRHFLARRGLPSSGVRVVERCIVDGEQLFILGSVAENSPTPDVDSVSSEPGFLSREAADLQRREMLEFMHVPIPPNLSTYNGASEAEREFNLNQPVIVRKGTGSEPFIISRLSQRELVDELAGESMLYIWGGPLLALASLAYLLVQLTQ